MRIAVLQRHREPDFRARRLAVGLFAATATWPRRNRLPRTPLARAGHFGAGVLLGAAAAAGLFWLFV